MDTKLVQEIRQTMDAKLTDELIAIYRHHHEEEYSAEAFEAIRQVLLTRGEAIPAINPPAGMGKVMESNAKREVVVTDVQMPFGSMVVFMIKWALAAIPAMIILAVIWAIVIGVFGGIFGAVGRR